nr:MAG TPA: hypothetical protein [Caudoviricetes sp.]
MGITHYIWAFFCVYMENNISYRHKPNLQSKI